MTQATQSAPPGLPVASPPGLPARTTGAAEPVLAGREIPRQLGRIRLVAVIIVLAFAALTALQLILANQALHAAAKDTEQLVRVQNIKVHMLRADALATNAFLVGGLEAPEVREKYTESITAASRTIAEAAEAQPLDGAVLAELNQVLIEYSEGMAQARATNRQGLPVGAGYLRASSAELRDRGVTLVDALVDANTERANASLGAQLPWLMALPAVAALIGLGLINQWIARRFRRRINTGLAAAAAAVLALGVAAITISATQAAANAHLRTGAYAAAVNGAEARSAANAAKTNESLRLISRGSGQAYEEAWEANATNVSLALDESELAAAPKEAWDNYVAGHHEVVELDRNGNWDGAVELATKRDDGSPTMQFSNFDEGMEQLVRGSAENTSKTLVSGSLGFIILTVLTILGGLGAAALGWRGVSARLKEYA
ncbi:hypothetical protein AADG42_10355 [Ammonicoccus fulvus]|uniref:Chemotaxis methyl-accepting receptor HlyB-like 4HB MCP domain-containing protein n=1 Tax=Ammonicoccus fulvus TaxID=3138240 RepID=A0ABZ3FSD0_9ACTN